MKKMRGRSGRLLAGALSLAMMLGGYAGAGSVAYAETADEAGTGSNAETQPDNNTESDGTQKPAVKMKVTSNSQVHFTTEEYTMSWG